MYSKKSWYAETLFPFLLHVNGEGLFKGPVLVFEIFFKTIQRRFNSSGISIFLDFSSITCFLHAPRRRRKIFFKKN